MAEPNVRNGSVRAFLFQTLLPRRNCYVLSIFLHFFKIFFQDFQDFSRFFLVNLFIFTFFFWPGAKKSYLFLIFFSGGLKPVYFVLYQFCRFCLFFSELSVVRIKCRRVARKNLCSKNQVQSSCEKSLCSKSQVRRSCEKKFV